jgi:pimeloyl-ACP methyl ester carboxylesterase
MSQTKSGFANINGAKIYYETAGKGIPFVMIHAGVADSRQWNNEFAYFAQKYQVVRYDMRGYGKSEPVEGDFSHLDDFVSLLEMLGIHQPFILMGCSMGGGLAMDFTVARQVQVKALIMVGSGPSGLELDVPVPAKFEEAEKAFQSGNLELLAEIETQIWFDGINRASGQANQEMRNLARKMSRTALDHEAKHLGKRLPDSKTPAFEHIKDLNVPVLIIVGAHDVPYILAAANYMMENIRTAQKATIEDAAHLPNMNHPHEFQAIVKKFLESRAL